MPRAFTERERQVLRRKLTDQARTRIEQVGIRATSVAELARAVGISKGAFYLLFDSKEELIREVLVQVEAEVRAALEERLASDRSPAEQMTTFVRFQFEALDRHPVLTLLADPEEGPVLFRSVPPEELAERMADDDRYFAEIARRLRDEGALHPEVADTIVAGIPRLALAITQGRELIGSDRFEELVELVCRGLGEQLAGDRP